MIDIVIPLGTSGPWQDNELRYALRAIEKNLSGYRDIYIVGKPRKWFQNLIVIDAEEHYTQKNYCIFAKTLKACMDERVSETFAFWNDDHYLLQPIDVREIKYWYWSNLKHLGTVAKGTYQRTVINTWKHLEKNGHTQLNYDIHTPILYEKEKFKQLAAEEWDKQEKIIKSLYCNIHRVKGEEMKDLKFGRSFTRDEIKKAIDGRMWFSTDDHGLNEAMKNTLRELYPNPSKYEKH